MRGGPLQRLLAPRIEVPLLRPPHIAGAAPIRFHADGWSVFATPAQPSAEGDVVLQRFRLDDGGFAELRVGVAGGPVQQPFWVEEAAHLLLSEAWRELAGPRGLRAGQLNLYYKLKQFIPRSVQLAARRALIRSTRLPEFPAWPLDLTLARLLGAYARLVLASLGRSEAPFTWFWPSGHTAAVILTHDVESEAGLRLAVGLADVEEERGLRSSFNLVADWYPIDFGIVRELTTRGFEIGVHGIHHDRSMFASRDSFERQRGLVREAAECFGAAGFRSPATHRVYSWLAELPVRYDCTMPHSDPFEPQPGGCCSLWPFFIGDVVELPWTLPQDHTLFTLLKQTSIDVWVRQSEEIIAAHGLLQSVTHPDPGYLGDPRMLAHYVEFLDWLTDRTGVWFALPREVAEWWRQRDRGEPEPYVALDGRFWLRGDGQVEFDAPVLTPRL